VIERALSETDRLGRVLVTVPAEQEFVGLVRMVVAGAAATARMDDEAVADLKVAVSEACTNVVRHAYDSLERHPERNIEIGVDLWDGVVQVEVRDRGGGVRSQEAKPGPRAETPEGGFGLYLIGSLMDNVEILGDHDSGTSLKFHKRRV